MCGGIDVVREKQMTDGGLQMMVVQLAHAYQP
jgi:hypothetical protein